MNEKELIPIERLEYKNNGEHYDEPWINYKKQVLVIEKDPDGDLGRFQFDGVSCLQGEVRGFIADSFKSDLKYFKPNFWYERTVWGTHYPTKIYFRDKKVKVPIDKIFSKGFLEKNKDNFTQAVAKAYDQTYKIIDPLAIEAKSILNTILLEVLNKTGVDYSTDFEDMRYGKGWYESYIPLKDDEGKKYLLTWENCD